MPSPMPKSVRVGAVSYRVICDEGILAGRNYAGEARDSDNTLNISRRLPLDRQHEVFWHELIHAAGFETLSGALRLKEAQVKVLATTLLRVMQDHPDVVEFVTGHEVSRRKGTR